MSEVVNESTHGKSVQSSSAAEIQEKALAHIKRCDELFDGNVVRPDKEFAYQQLRVLTLELLEKVVGA